MNFNLTSFKAAELLLQGKMIAYKVDIHETWLYKIEDDWVQCCEKVRSKKSWCEFYPSRFFIDGNYDEGQYALFEWSDLNEL